MLKTLDSINRQDLELPSQIGKWLSIYWEPVPATDERICIGCLTEFAGNIYSHSFVRDDLLEAMYGKNASKARGMIEKILSNARFIAQKKGLEEKIRPFSSAYFGDVQVLHCQTPNELTRAALLMSSSLGVMADPSSLQAEDIAEENTVTNRQFITRIRDEVSARHPDLAQYFNQEASLKSQRSTVKFGFLSNELVAHIGMLQMTNLAKQIRNARGLMAEVNLLHESRNRSGNAGIILGIPTINSPLLNDKQRYALEGATEELRLECKDFRVEFHAAETDGEAANQLIEMIN